MDAQRLIDEVIAREGGYTNHPADRGGPTRWGITEQVARAHGYRDDMRNLPRVVAVEIYFNRYWHGPGFDRVGALYPALAVELLDIGVNMGTEWPARWLQRSLNALNNGASLYPDIAVDGRIGNMTLDALKLFKQRRGAEGEAVLLESIRSFRGVRYIEITEARPANEAFTYGWFRRMVDMLKERFK